MCPFNVHVLNGLNGSAFIFSNDFFTFCFWILFQFLSVRGARPGKQVDLSEAEIKMLCLRSRDLLIGQPMLLELEAPIQNLR
jgi:hypothetical protein